MRTRSEIQKEYNQLYTKYPNKWDGTSRTDFMVEVLKEHMPYPRTVIDVGCGNGVTLQNYRRYDTEAKLYGIDLSTVGLRLAKERVPDGIFTTNENFEDVTEFDLVLCLGTAEHVEDLPPFLKSLKEKISEWGVCYFEVPNNLVYSNGPAIYRQLETRSRQYEWHLTRDTWEELLLQAGFEIVEQIKGLNVTWEFIWILK